MFSIARQFGVPLQELINANPQIPDPSRLVPGQTVCVPISAPPPSQCPPNTFPYTVQPGDGMFSIAQRFGVSLNALIAANPQIPNPNLIFPGQIVCVPRTTQRSARREHSVTLCSPGTVCSPSLNDLGSPQRPDRSKSADSQPKSDLPRSNRVRAGKSPPSQCPPGTSPTRSDQAIACSALPGASGSPLMP